ncbi:MAG: DNA repair protein RecN, partial [Cytophagales bacterium]
QSLSSFLIDIHSQHDNLILTSETYQMKLLDSFCETTELNEQYVIAFRAYNEAKKAWKSLFDDAESKRKEREFEIYVFNELEQAKLLPNEYEQLEIQLKELDNAQEIAEKLTELKRILDEDDFSVVNQLASMVSQSERLAALSSGFKVTKDRLKSIFLEAKDIAAELDKVNTGESLDQEQITEKRNRFDLINSLMFKHKCSDYGELLKYRDELSSKLSMFESVDDQLEALHKNMQEARKKTAALADELSKKRNNKKGDLEKAIVQLLTDLSMKDSVLKWDLTKNDDLGKNGWDQVKLLFSANKGFEAKEIKNTASGGEFSRLMLCLKYILAQKSNLPTLIFDEIDTGISGDVALKMAKMMKNMSKGHQLLAITHLPQIAAAGNEHFFVYKKTEKGKTISAIKSLKQEERMKEIAVMMSGNEFSSSAKDSAAELMAAFK